MSSVRLFVGNVEYSALEQELKDIFAPYGVLASVSVAVDRETGKPRGFAFVEYLDSEDASRAIVGTDGRELHGRQLRVSAARERAVDASGPSKNGRS